jgi:transposase
MTCTLGIDVAKATLAVALLDEQGRWQTGAFANSPAGFSRLLAWLRHRSEAAVHVCLEATGRYSRGVAAFLHAQGYAVSVVNPAHTPLYRSLRGGRHKTDKSDAKLLAQFCATHHPAPSTPPTPQQEQLQELTRHLDSLKQAQTRVRNRLAAGPTTAWVRRDLADELAALQRRIADLEQEIEAATHQDPDQAHQMALLTSIPGLGTITAARFLAEVPDFRRFAQADQLAAYAGLVPTLHDSGTSVHKPAKLSKAGNAHLRHAFYMPALSAMRCNPLIRRLVERLTARGKAKMTIVAAVMHKLLRLAYGVLKTDRPFDPDFAASPP